MKLRFPVWCQPLFLENMGKKGENMNDMITNNNNQHQVAGWNPGLSAEKREEIWLKHYDKIACQDHKLAMELAKIHEARESELKILERKEELKAAREFITYKIYRDEEGHLCRMSVDAMGKVVSDKRISDTIDISLCRLYYHNAPEKEAVYSLAWDGVTRSSCIYLPEREFTAERLQKLLPKAGISIAGDRDHKSGTLEQVISYLVKTKVDCEIPRFTGWVETSEGWKWIEDGAFTWREVMKYAEL